MADVNSTDHLVRPEKDTLANGYDNEGFHNRGEDGEESASDEKRLRVVVTENGRVPPETSPPLPNGHAREEANGHAVNGTAVVFVDEDMDRNSRACATEQQKPLDTRLHHYVSADDMDKKILNGSDGGTHVSIPEDAVISFSSGRVRVKKGAPSNSPQSPRDRESIPLETMPPSYEGKAGLSGEKAELEAELSNHKNGVWSEGHTYGSAESHFISEKLNGTSKSSDEVSLPVNNHRKCLSREGSISSCSERKSTGEKLYFTEESRKLCPGWRRLLICGLILIMIAIALLLGVLAATGILLSKSDSKNTRYESGHPLPNMDSISHAGHSFRPKPSSNVPQKFQPPVTVEAEHFPNATPAATLDVHDTVSQAPPTVTSKVPPLLNDSSHSQTIVPNALVGEFKIIDENFTDDLNDHSSRGYLNLARNLETELRRIFRDNGGKFDELKVLNFRPGSIKVKFVVIWSSDQGIISSDKATEVLSADLRKKNNSFYNFIYVDMSSIQFINAFDECRIQKGGCAFDCVWNYDTLLKTCICPNNMYLLLDGKSCSPIPETSSIPLFITSTTSPQQQPSSQTMPIFAATGSTEMSKPSQENEPTLFPFPDVLITTTPKTTEFFPTDEGPATETYFKENLDTKPESTTTEIPTTYPQTFPVEGIDGITTTQSPKGSSYSIGEKTDLFPETTTVAETTLLSKEEKTGIPQSAYTAESATSIEDATTQTTPSSFRGLAETFTTGTGETVYPNYDTTMYYNPYPYPPNIKTETSPDQTENPSTYYHPYTYPPNIKTETSPDQTEIPPTTRSSTLKYHIPEPATEVYTWSPHYDYPTEYFNPPPVTDTHSTDYTAYTKPEQETFPVTYDEGIADGSGPETTTPNIVETMTETTVTSAPSIKREGSWQENQTLPTTFDGSVWGDQTEHTTIRDEATHFPQEDSVAYNQTTTESTMEKDDSITTANPYTHPTFPFFIPSFNRTPGVRSYDNFTDYYDNSTFVADHEDYSTDTTVGETPTEAYSSMSYSPSYSWNESSTSYQPTTETTYSGGRFTDTTMVNLNSPNVSDKSPTVGSSASYSPIFTTQSGFFNVTEGVEPEVTDETPISTFPTESNMTFPFKAVTDTYLTETPVYNQDGMNLTSSGNFYPPVDINTETPHYNFTTSAATGSDGAETEEETLNPTFPTESTAQFPSKVITESYNPEETTLYNFEGMNWTTTESFSPSQDYNTETIQDNFTFPSRDNETESIVQHVTTTVVNQEMGAESTKQFATVPGHTEPSFPYVPSNVTYEAETTAVADSETTVSMQESDGTTNEQRETTTVILMDEVTTQTPFVSEFPRTPDYGTDYPMKSAKSVNESTPFYGWGENTPDTDATTLYPDSKSQMDTSAASFPSETTVDSQSDTVMEVTTSAAYAETDTVTPLPTLLPFTDWNKYGTNADQTTVITTEPPPIASYSTESDLAKVSSFDTTIPTAKHVSETDYTTPYEETMPTTHGSGPAAIETDATTLTSYETDQPTIPASEKSFRFNDTLAITGQSTMATSKVPLTTESYNTETVVTTAYTESGVTTAYTEYQTFSNNTDIGNTTLMLSETSNNRSRSYDENSETTIVYPDTTLTAVRFSNESEQSSTLDSNSTLVYLTTPLSDYDNDSTVITGFPYDIDEATTFAPYAFEDTTVMADAELDFNLTSNVNKSDGNSTDEFGAFYPYNFNSTDNNYTVINENFNVTTTGYDVLNETTTNASIGVVCRDDQFICEPLNVCLNYTFMCDGIKDCPDGIDESDCQGTCHTNFMCSNSSNMCIMSELQCDGIWDCENGTDEEFCKPSECAKHEVMCSDQSKCIRPSDICDLKYDCKDRSDEVGCVERTTCESGGKFFCNDGLCIPWSLKCDGEYDCKEREDEGNCTCLSDEFQCNDGKCLKSSSRCDGHKDCHDGDDEMGCVNVDAQHLVMTYEPYSGTWAMLCAEDWSLDDGHYLCQELGFGHALKTEKLHVSFNGTWMAMRRENLTDASLWTERVSFVESCTSSLAASVECQKFACGEYSGLLHRRKRELSGLSSSSSSASQWPFVGYTSTFYSSKGCLSEILTPIWLITSADCLLSISKQPFNGSDWYVRTNIGRSVEAGSVQNHEVLRMISHPHSSKFRSLTVRDYDVALIRLKHALVFVSDKIGAICPPDEQVPPGITCFSGVLGMQTPRAPPPTSLTINSLALQIIDRKNCNSVDHYNNLINQRMLCTQSSEGHTICDYDEGTPLMCLTGINKWFLAGMLSYQRYCEVYNKHPAVFSNLYSMRKFIDQVTGQKQYEIPHDSNVYMIIPPTTPSPTIPETTTIVYTTTESLSTTETTLSDFSTTMGVLNYDMTVNGTSYETEVTTLMENFTESSTTPLDSMYEDATLPSDEFVEEMRGESNYTTLPPGAFVDGNTTETTLRYPETTYKLKGTYTPDYSIYEEARVLNLTSDNTTGTQDVTTFSPLEFRNNENFTGTTIPLTDTVTLDSEIRSDSDNSSDLEPKMFETTFNSSDMVNKTHDSMMEAQPNETYPGNSFVPYFMSDNKTELYGINTTAPVDEAAMVTQPEVPSTIWTTEYATDYDIFNSSGVSLTRMPVMSMANETLDTVIEPERLTLTTISDVGDQRTTTEEGNATETTINSSDANPTTTESPDWANYKDAITETDLRKEGFTERPLSYEEVTTLGGDLKETETIGYTENPSMVEETTTDDMKERLIEPELKMEGRADTFHLLKENTPTDFTLKETTPTDFTLKETTPTDFTLKETTPIDFSLKETTPTDFSLKETTPTDFTLKETTPTDFTLKETTPIDFSLKETTPTDFSLKKTTPVDISLKETTPVDFSLKETTPADLSLKETTLADLSLKETSPSDFSLRETITNDSNLRETTTESSTGDLTKSHLMKETTTIDLGLKGTETPYVMEETTTPVSGWRESTAESETIVDAITENPHFDGEATTSAPENTTPSLETRTLMFETEVGTDGDIALIAFNDSDGIVLQPAEYSDGLSIVENNGSSKDYNMSRSRMLDEPVQPSDIIYDTMQPNRDYTTTTLDPDATDSITTEWEDYYTTLTTPRSVDEDLTTTTETAREDSIVVATPSYQLPKDNTETTSPNLQTEQYPTETTPFMEYDGTMPPGLSTMKFRSNDEVNVTGKENYFLDDAGLCGTWDYPSNDSNLNETKFYKEWPALGYLQLISDKRMCAASLISSRFVITSLNCLSVRDNQLDPDKWAYVGGLYVNDPSIDGQQTHLIAEIIPFANSSTSLLFHENNLALVRIKDEVRINNFSKSVCLPKDIQPDQQCYTTGWGQVPTGIEEGKRFYSVPVRIIPQDECNSTSNYNGLLLDSLICASYSNQSFPTCQMDLGSPLFCLNNAQWELQGVLNFPNPCDMVQPAVYNSLSKVQEWIQDILLRYSS